MSSLAARMPKSPLSKRRPSASGISMPRCTASSTRGDRERPVLEDRRARASPLRRAAGRCGTTRFTSPIRSASSAFTRRAVSHELERARRADQPRQALRAAVARDDPERDLGQSEHRVLRREPQMTGERQLASAAEGVPVDGGDHRLGRLLEHVEHALAEARDVLGAARVEHRQLVDVRARDEALGAAAGDDQRALLGVGHESRGAVARSRPASRG